METCVLHIFIGSLQLILVKVSGVAMLRESDANSFCLAETVRFELTNGFPLLVFKTSAFSHSAISPLMAIIGVVEGSVNRNLNF